MAKNKLMDVMALPHEYSYENEYLEKSRTVFMEPIKLGN